MHEAMTTTAPAETFFWVITYGDKTATFTPFATHREAVKDSLGANSGCKEVVGTSTTKGRPVTFIEGVAASMRAQGVEVAIAI